MTFARIKSLGWAFGEILTSAQQTQLDLDHSRALNGLGDTATGPMVFGSSVAVTGLITCNGGALYPNLAMCAFASGSSLYMFAGSLQTVEVGATIACAGTISGSTAFSGNKTVANASSITWGTGATCTLGNGSTCTHAGGSAETYANSSTCSHASGSSDTYDAGAVLVFNNTPDVNGGLDINGSGYVSYREYDLVDANATITPANGDIFYGGALTAGRILDVNHTGVRIGARITIVNPTTNALTVRDGETATTIAVVRESPSAGQYRRSVTIYRNGSVDAWVLEHGQLT